jgi:hypothetical protein
VGFGLSPQLKTSFEQIFSAPFLLELLLVELGAAPGQDLLVRLHFDGGFQIQPGVAVAAAQPETESAAQQWLTEKLAGKADRREAAELILRAWWTIVEGKPFPEAGKEGEIPGEGWKDGVKDKVVEIGWLARQSPQAARFEMLTLTEIGL